MAAARRARPHRDRAGRHRHARSPGDGARGGTAPRRLSPTQVAGDVEADAGARASDLDAISGAHACSCAAACASWRRHFPEQSQHLGRRGAGRASVSTAPRPSWSPIPALSETAHELEIHAAPGKAVLTARRSRRAARRRSGRLHDLQPDAHAAPQAGAGGDLMGDPVAFLQTLIRAQPGGEAAVQRVVADAARSLGCTRRDGALPAGRRADGGASSRAPVRSMQASATSVVARFKGKGGGRSLIFFAHPDGEPVAGTERWKRDPFAGIVDNGRIHGWGVADDLSRRRHPDRGTAAPSLRRATRRRATSSWPARPASDMRAASRRCCMADLRADAAVYLHPAESGVGMREIKAFASGLLEFRVTVEGSAPDTNEISHPAFAHKAVNPLDKLWLVYRALQALDARRAAAIRHPALEQAIGRSTNLLVSHMRRGQCRRLRARRPKRSRWRPRSRFPPAETLGHVQAADRSGVARSGGERCLAEGSSAAPGIRFRRHRRRGADRRSALSHRRRCRSSASPASAPHVNPLHTSSDIRNPIVQAGIPTVGPRAAGRRSHPERPARRMGRCRGLPAVGESRGGDHRRLVRRRLNQSGTSSASASKLHPESHPTGADSWGINMNRSSIDTTTFAAVAC